MLTRGGICLKALGQDVDLAAEIFRVSDGDPLLIRLYIEELGSGATSGQFRPEALREIQPGLKAFFEKWFEDQTSGASSVRSGKRQCGHC